MNFFCADFLTNHEPADTNMHSIEFVATPLEHDYLRCEHGTTHSENGVRVLHETIYFLLGLSILFMLASR